MTAEQIPDACVPIAPSDLTERGKRLNPSAVAMLAAMAIVRARVLVDMGDHAMRGNLTLGRIGCGMVTCGGTGPWRVGEGKRDSFRLRNES